MKFIVIKLSTMQWCNKNGTSRVIIRDVINSLPEILQKEKDLFRIYFTLFKKI